MDFILNSIIDFTFADLAFVIIAGITIAGALGVVISKNIVHSALFLVLAFLGVAGLFFGLDAQFLGIIQIFVYAGAISVLFIFAVMLVMKENVNQTNTYNRRIGVHFLGLFVAAGFIAIMACSIRVSQLTQVMGDAVKDTIGTLASMLMGDYVAAFEIAAVLLLVAAVGAIILAKGAEKQ